MTKERFSNLTVLNSHKERTARFTPTPPPRLHFKRGGHRAPLFKKCSAGPVNRRRRRLRKRHLKSEVVML